MIEEARQMAASAPEMQTQQSQPQHLGNLEAFRANGVVIADWARSKGFAPALVYAVLRGERKCLRGQSFDIAKALGMK